MLANSHMIYTCQQATVIQLEDRTRTSPMSARQLNLMNLKTERDARQWRQRKLFEFRTLNEHMLCLFTRKINRNETAQSRQKGRETGVRVKRYYA